MILFNGSIVGLTFNPSKTNFKNVIEFFESHADASEVIPIARLKAEPMNKFDRYAVQVYLGVEGKLWHCGYIPRPCNRKVFEALLSSKVQVDIENFNFFENEVRGYSIRVRS